MVCMTACSTMAMASCTWVVPQMATQVNGKRLNGISHSSERMYCDDQCLCLCLFNMAMLRCANRHGSHLFRLALSHSSRQCRDDTSPMMALEWMCALSCLMLPSLPTRWPIHLPPLESVQRQVYFLFSTHSMSILNGKLHLPECRH